MRMRPWHAPTLFAAAAAALLVATGCGGGSGGDDDSAAASPIASAAEPAAFVRGPYLTRVTETEARLRWVAMPGTRVRLTASTGSGTTVRAQRGHFRGLQPDTAHRWVATVDGRPAATGGFVTAPTDLGRPVRLIAFGDYGAVNDGSRAVAEMAAGEDARLLVTMGDNMYPVTAPQVFDTNVFLPLRATLSRMPNYGTMGDHDIVFPGARRALAAAFDWPGGGERYALRYGPVQVVALGLEGDADDIAFLRRALRVRGPLARLVVTHRPIQEGNPLLPIIAAGGVTAVLSGHLHAYERRARPEAPGVPFLTIGTGGAPRNSSHTPRSPDATVHIAAFGLLRIVLHGDRADYEFVDVDGRTHDRFSAPLTP